MAVRLQAAASVNGVLVGEQTFRRRGTRSNTERPSRWRQREERADPGMAGDSRAGAARRRPLPAPFALRRPRARAGRLAGATHLGRLRTLAPARHDPRRPGHRQDTPRLGVGTRSRRGRSASRWRQGRSLPYGDGISLRALREMVKAEAGILEGDPTEKAARKLRKPVRRIVENPATPTGSHATWAPSSG